ncbi:MAG TPA: helix-turn-helix domain-containing protein [Candidatus Limnocylindrales bacterium]|nr:helix-turn-helix domain-containing protein [Candidatus Limnocylindrales bacterium]
MPTRRRTRLALDAERINREQLARLGSDVRAARLRRRLTQSQLGARVGLAQTTVSALERGHGGGLSLDAWQRVGLALGMPLRPAFQRDPREEPVDAGHLLLQELVIRLGRAAGFGAQLELPTRPHEPWRSIDVTLADDVRRRLIVVECWNTIGDVGAAARGSARKAAEAKDIATGRWGDVPHGVGLVWVVRATARNRALIARYPGVFAARFPGSSAGWVLSLTSGRPPPAEPGLVWASVDGTRIWPWRRR